MVRCFGRAVIRRGRSVQTRGFFLEDLPRAVFGAVVDDNYLVRDAAEFQLEVQVLDGGCDAAFIVTRGNDDRQEAHKTRAETGNLRPEGGGRKPET